MRVQLWADMEGVAGITNWEQVKGGTQLYQDARRLYTNEINAAIRGCKRAGATEIIAIDGHGAGGSYTFNSWVPDMLEAGVKYVNGYRWGSYVQGFADGVDALLLPGAHAKAGTPDGVLCHTMSSANWVNAYINGVAVGESGLVAGIAGSFGVPVVFASGDTATCKEVRELLGESVVCAEVKQGLGRTAAVSLAHKDACDLIEEKVYEALKNRDNWPKPYECSPAEFKVELHSPHESEKYVGRTGVEVVDGRTVVSKGKTFWDAWNQFYDRD